MLAPWKKCYDKPRWYMKKQKHYFAHNGSFSQSYSFSSSHVWMWELDHKESWELSPLDCKEIKPVHPKGNQSWIFIGRMDAEAEAPILWPPAASLEKTLMLARLKAREGDDRGWDGWMASLTQWTWVWANTGREWRTGKPGLLQSMGSQRVRHNLATE